MRDVRPPDPTLRWVVPAAGILAALVIAIPVAHLTGVVSPLVLGDPGPLVRWGMVLGRIVHDMAAALTIGLLLVAAFLAREGKSTDRRGTAARAATLAGGLWLAGGLSVLYLGFGDLAGMSPGEPGYIGLLLDNLWGLEANRLRVIEAVLVVVVILLASWARTRVALAWTFVVALVALLPLAYGGHAGSLDGHHTAVTSLGMHLLGVTVWVGGLMAIGLLLPVLGPALEDTVRRFSPLATWCFVLVGLSGVIFTLNNIDSLAGLTSTYGILAQLKVGALMLLGAAGVQQRRSVIARGVRDGATFARLALGEVLLMGAAVGLGVVLSRTEPPGRGSGERDMALQLTGFPLPEPWSAGQLLTAWRTDWLFLLFALTAVGVYVWAMLRLRARGDHWPVWRLLLWVAGWAIFIYATNGAPGVYGRIMFSMHMVMHMALMMAVPVLLVPANVITLLLRALPKRKDRTLGPREVLLGITHSRWATFIANPLVAGVIFFGSLIAFYWTSLLPWALSSHLGHVFMVVHFTLSGYAFVWALVGTDPGPKKWPAPLRLMVAIGTLAAHAFFGLSLMQGTWLLAPEFFKPLAVPWVPDLLVDQQLGGAIAWGIGELPTVILSLMIAVDWMRRDHRDQVRQDRQADRDGDAELAAYNARLADLAERSRRSP